jgi:hypothetical protein
VWFIPSFGCVETDTGDTTFRMGLTEAGLDGDAACLGAAVAVSALALGAAVAVSALALGAAVVVSALALGAAVAVSALALGAAGSDEAASTTFFLSFFGFELSVFSAWTSAFLSVMACVCWRRPVA